MTYPDSVKYLYSLGNEVQTAKLGLDRITRLLEAIGSPHRAGRFVHVAGTNGKGSTCAMIESGLRAAGIRTGLYTSPHLKEPAERIQIAGHPVSEAQFAEAFVEVHALAERMLRSGEIDLHPTYFETVTAMAFLLFARARVGAVVLEVGLGGRLDATNVVTPTLSVITPIDLDHQVFLGDTLEKIAAEKAGILKPGVPAIFAEQHPEAEAVLRAHAQAPYTLTREWPITELQIDARGSKFRLRDQEIVCPLAGQHQVENARCAAIALSHLNVSPAGIAQTVWPGRLELVSRHPEMILDGAHNPAGARALADYIRGFYADRKIWIVYGVMRDKAVDEMTALLFPLAERVILTAPNNSRALPPQEIHTPGATIAASVSQALALLRDAPPETAIFITGSLFVVGEARALLVQ
ncbi:MAG TPA: folylpolyglutamate synthase/dihydrofolate synthase family protein [Bryobacteraceae bacterium]|nr:folylpolyglutamate synthase/dihydrofolate synthase family protein [Bryobacteraceae bacterium]